MIVYKVILFTLFITISQCRIPDKVYCVNKECSVPISKARTLINYSTADADLISFRGNTEAIVYMKSAGANSELWYISANGKFGFANSKFLRETKMYERNPQEVIPIEDAINFFHPVVQPNKVKQPHEIVEGTTIYTTEATIQQPDTSTELPPQSVGETPELVDNKDVVLSNEKQESNEKIDFKNTNADLDLEVNQHLEENLEPSSAEDEEDEDEDLEPEEPESDNVIAANYNAETPDTQSNVSTVDTPPVDEANYSNVKVNSQDSIKLPTQDVSVDSQTPLQPFLSSNSRNVNTQSIEMPERIDPIHPALDKSNPNDVNELNSSEITEETVTPVSSTEVPKVPKSETAPLTSQIKTEPSALPAHDSDAYGNVENSDNNPYNVNGGALENDFRDPAVNMPPTNADSLFKSSENIYNSEGNLVVNELVQDNEPEPITSPESILIPEIKSNPDPISNLDSNIKYEPHHFNSESYQTPEPIANIDSTMKPEPLLNSEPIKAPEPVANLDSTIKPEPISNNEHSPILEQSVQSTDSKHIDTPTIPEESSKVLSATETLPAVFPNPEPAIPASADTLPPIFNEQAPTEPPALYSQPEAYTHDPYTHSPAQDLSTEQTTSEVYSYSTPSPIEETFTTPDLPVEDFYPVTTEAPQEEKTEESSEGFFSSMYTTVSDLWPSTTEASPSIFNTEDYPTYEEEKTDGKDGFSFWGYIMSSYYSVMGINDEEIKALFPAVGETCYSNEYCDGVDNSPRNRFLTFLLMAASSVLLFTLGYYYIDNRRQDGKLIGTINSLQRDLLFATKECEILKEELSTTKTKLARIEDNSFGMDDMVQSLREEINELKAQNESLRNTLDDNEKLLRVSENTAGELQHTLGEVENTLSELLGERATAEEHIAELNEKIQLFKEELIIMTKERDNYQLKFVSAEASLQDAKKYKKQLEEISQQYAEAKNTIELQKHESIALKDAIKELNSGSSSNVDATTLIDHTEIKAKLTKALEEKQSLDKKYEAEHSTRKRLAEELQSAQESLATSTQQANEAATRLEVLEKYFKEREGELLKELSAKESLWLSKQGESTSTVEKMELLQQETQRHKEKCDALTLELAEQESSRRSALSEVETRAHTAWLEARAARREADAARDEAATLRRKLASMTVADGAVSPHHKVVSPLEGAEGVLPPPLPLPFLPPPLLPPLPRPPPLGRLPSPHPPRYSERRYSPDSRYSPESRYSPDTVRYSPDSRYSPHSRRPAYSPRRRRSRERYPEARAPRSRNGPADTETEYNSDSPPREPRRRRYSRHSGPSSGSGCSSESDKR